MGNYLGKGKIDLESSPSQEKASDESQPIEPKVGYSSIPDNSSAEGVGIRTGAGEIKPLK